jgi:hypothetical protein
MTYHFKRNAEDELIIVTLLDMGKNIITVMKDVL